MNGLLGEKFDAGDTATCNDKESELYGRECVVVHSDPLFCAVISEGIKQIHFFSPKDKSYRLVRAGRGVLDDSQKTLLKHVMSHWGHTGFMKDLPRINRNNRHKMEIGGDKKMHVHLDGFVPEALAVGLKQIRMLIDMSKETNPDIASDINDHFLEWVISNTIHSMMFTQFFRSFMNNEEEGGEEEPGAAA